MAVLLIPRPCCELQELPPSNPPFDLPLKDAAVYSRVWSWVQDD